MRQALTISLFAFCLATPLMAAPVTLYVSPTGNDAWSGKLPQANAARTDGPLATVLAARNVVRKLHAASAEAAGQPVTVYLRGGTYRMDEPLVLTPADTGLEGAPITYAAYQGEKPILSGGRVITGWKQGPGKLWTATIPDVAGGNWYFQQLFVDGKRATRARTPSKGYFHIVSKAPPLHDPATGKDIARDQTAFVYAPGDIKPWPDLQDVNVVIYHSWETSRLRIAKIDDDQHIVTFTGTACWPFLSWGPQQRFYVENTPDALDTPGEWYLDRHTGVLSYYPMPGEDMQKAEVVAPYLTRLVDLRGDAAMGAYVESIAFRGITFSHEDWTLEPTGHSDGQAAVTVPAAFMADGARDCTVENCEITHVGDYAIWFRRGCVGNKIVHCRIHDMGVGGVRVGEANPAADDNDESRGTLIDNNHIYDGGHVYPAGVGIWVAQSSHNTISHNEIHDLPYSGMSIGWNWGDEPNRTHHNIIEFNHVHHVMNGVLSDGGAIYTLGNAPGSVIRNNVLHDVWPFDQPPLGWGIYLDATSSQYLVENNIVYNARTGGLMYNNGGHEHEIRNNVFADFADYALWPYWERRPNTFANNIVYLSQGSMFPPFAESSLNERKKAGEDIGVWDDNVYFSPKQPDIRFFKHDFADWQKLGLDTHSLIADPQFVDAANYDFRLKPDSPALKLGFKPIDTSKVGLYGDPAWVNEARNLKYPRAVFPTPPGPPKPLTVDDDFENEPVGAPPPNAVVSGEEQGASIRVTDEQAASGKHSLKFTDVTGLQFTWQPHMFYQPHITAGTVTESFDLRLEPKARMFTEWRDEGDYPANIGPSVHFDSAGPVTVGGKTLTTVPVSQWVHVSIEAKVGKGNPRTFTLTITVPGHDPQTFEGLAMPGDGFDELHWLGFVSDVAANSVFYIDNLKITPVSR